MKILHPNLIRKSMLFFVLLGVISCGKDDAPPTPIDPCNTTPLLAIAVTIQGSTITATAAGGEAPYTFQLDNGAFQSSGTFSNLDPKEYTVTVKDANDCIDFLKATVADPCTDSTLAVEATAESNTITATASEGTEPYTYSLDGTNFQESNEFTDQDAGDYTVTVKDANGCTAETEVSVAAIVDPCLGSTLKVDVTVANYVITAVGSEGTAPYTYSVDGTNFQESGVFDSQVMGDYTVTVKDANGCTSTTDVSVTCEDSGLELSVTAAAFEIVATGSGGKAPYSYSINGENFQESGTFSDLEQQNYTVTIKDDNDCTTTYGVLAENLASFIDDRDGQTYKLTKIGDQIWFAENLNYQGEDVIYYCYDDDPANCDTYGAIYDIEYKQNAVPQGWHLPTPAEIDALAAELGGYDVAGDAMKVGGSSGFEALYGGYFNAPYGGIGLIALWHLNENENDAANFFSIENQSSGLSVQGGDAYVYIRAIKD
ncbi:FISUMP domain-containing protein [Flagellimonas zhangzhouensis]|uniref:Major paralogous domain-containing protein n=1 Tax=Flagellimonas zhangzhouensis TaxID=1073328 RepID=A0A1H2ULC7_9FLAO|nr:FISUMP domain-containing protein [Allomuricauda zhangzhouensis]SDQ16094.1 major paralogous domain-containing protein [Allomuricauda zhangzhouensis]SDW56758.1 major paralogous domain-containing protein [Allomuricauda zhangzhouensis]